MNKTTLGLMLMAAPALAPSAHAVSELDLSVSSEVVAMEYRLRDEVRGSRWGVGAMYNDDNKAALASATFNVVGQADATGETFTGLGLKAVVHDTDLQTAASLALGGSVQYQPAELNGFGVQGQLYYAPEILNTNDAEAYHELMARVTYLVHPQARVFAGWTNATVKYDDPIVNEVRVERAVNLGFTLIF